MVVTAHGALRGARKAGIGSWRGIPYAAPPVGPLRFRSPRLPLPWRGIREATRFSPCAPQPASPAEHLLGIEGHGPSSEDCLTLNVWSQGPGGAARPVLVWLHGGSFLTGAGSDTLYDGHGFAAQGDIVVVTLNYRMGPLGFLHLGTAGPFEENLGLRDQIAALRWVRDNIDVFGGDPGRVTLCGQSAGAMAVGTLLGVPEARGLFARAILQSGAAQHVHRRAGAARVARLFLHDLGLRGPDADALRALPTEALVAAALAVTRRPGLLGLPFQPVIDGALIPCPPLDAIRTGASAGVPLLIGTTRDELSLYALLAARQPPPTLRQRIDRLGAIADLAASLGLRRMNRLRRAYPLNPAGLAAFAGDAVFRMPAIALAEAQGSHAPVYAYRFDWRSAAHGGRLGACHALDVAFAWNTIDRPEARTLVGHAPSARPLAAAMHAAWIGFVRTGRPEAVALPAWPPYERRRRATMILEASSRVEDDPEGERRVAWRATGETDGKPKERQALAQPRRPKSR